MMRNMNIKEKLTKPIVLVGMMGCGKSHAGRLLSNALDLPFYDSDQLIEKQQGRSIPEIFDVHGERFFRLLEMEKISSLLDLGTGVISTGGGCLTIPAILSDIKARGLSLWIKTDIDTLYERLKTSDNRPLLDCDDPRQKLYDLFEERKDLYSQADIIVEDPLQGVEMLARSLEAAIVHHIQSK